MGVTRSGRTYQETNPPHEPEPEEEVEASVEEVFAEEEVEDTKTVEEDDRGGWSDPYDSDDEMAQIYGASRGIRRFSGVVGTIELDDFIIEFGGWCNGQAERRASFNPFSTWQALFQHLEGAPMHDYAEFEVRYKVEIEIFQRYWAPDFKDLFGGAIGFGGQRLARLAIKEPIVVEGDNTIVKDEGNSSRATEDKGKQ